LDDLYDQLTKDLANQRNWIKDIEEQLVAQQPVVDGDENKVDRQLEQQKVCCKNHDR
jgi:hypothetical protein